ncbi:MAG: 3-dehydroquinate synthase, partial [Chitinophagaceae bacterium]
MKKLSYTFSAKTTDYYFDGDLSKLDTLIDRSHTVLITDENIFAAHKKKLKGWDCIVLKPGEEFKVQATVNNIIEQLIAFKADRKT